MEPEREDDPRFPIWTPPPGFLGRRGTFAAPPKSGWRRHVVRAGALLLLTYMVGLPVWLLAR